MDRGSYVAAAGGLLQFRKLDVVNNNLANVNTPGFKGQFLVNRGQEFSETLAEKMHGPDPHAAADHARCFGPISIQSATDFSAGPVKNTSNPLDVALHHPLDFFVVEAEAGLQYTRAGSFSLSADGLLVTPDGYTVQGDSGAITVSGGAARISSSGDVLVDGQTVARLRVVRFEDPSVLERSAGTRFAAGPGAQLEDVPANVVPESLEMSNVSAIQSMIELITANRAFALYSKTASTIDDTNNNAISRVGRRM